MNQPRNEQGRFGQKGDEKRKLRSVRLTDPVWNKLGKVADRYNISRSDLIEKLLNQEHQDLKEAIEILEKTLTLKVNAKGAINNQIKNALKILLKL